MELKEIYENNPLLSLSAALKAVSSEELLIEVAGQFADGMEENLELIESYMMERDYKNYTIKLHSLKSSAKMIGEEGLSSLSYTLEELGKSADAGDKEAEKQLLRHTPEAVVRYLKAGYALKALKEDPDENKGSLKEEAPEGKYAEFREKAAEYTDAFDSEGIEDLLDDVGKYRFRPEEEEFIRSFKKAYDGADWDRLNELTGNEA